MSGGSLQDRIAQVLAEHMFRITGESDQPTCCDCQEGRSGVDGWMLTMEPQEHAAHVAAAVLAALGLTEERDVLDWDACGDPGVSGKQSMVRAVSESVVFEDPS